MKNIRWVIFLIALACLVVGCAAPPAEVAGVDEPVVEYQAVPSIPPAELAGENEPELEYQPARNLPPVSIPYDTFIPLFEYGEGVGTLGQIRFVVSMVFMSEEKAFAILSAAFADAGLTLNMEEQPLNDKILPVTNRYAWPPLPQLETTQGELTVWSLDVDGWLPVTFVSRSDVISWQGDFGWASSMTYYDTLTAARVLAENNPRLAVFYDPVVGPFSEGWREPVRKPGESDEEFSARGRYEWMQYIRAEAKRLQREVPREQQPGESDEEYRRRMGDEWQKNVYARSEKVLRQQAEALIEWLRAEGHI